MAKDFAKAFYKSRAWREVRWQALRRDHFQCVQCGDIAEEVDHIIELTPENIDDPRIALSLENLQSLCHDCHTRKTKGWGADLGDGFAFDESGQVIRIAADTPRGDKK